MESLQASLFDVGQLELQCIHACRCKVVLDLYSSLEPGLTSELDRTCALGKQM